MKPWQIFLHSLAPWLRYKPEFILCLAIIPNHLKLQAAKKYYDFAAEFEMNTLQLYGICGIRVLMYGTSLDTPGRRELLSMQSEQSYNPCPMCMHTWQPGHSAVVYGGFRRCLPPQHPWRAKTFRVGQLVYEFRDVESRPPPIQRTDTLVDLALLRAKPWRPFLGHKSLPLLYNWVGADWGRSMPDWMHDLKCFTEMLLRCWVGKGTKTGIFAGWGNKDAVHREDCRVFGVFADFAGGALPPWRLTAAQVNLMDARVKSMWWPHYADKLAWKGHSFWKRSDRIWKAKHKLFCLLSVFPTCLRGFVKESHFALLHIVDALTQLKGACVSVQRSKDLGVCPYDKQVVDENRITLLGKQLLKGLVLLEGSFPVAHLNPILHSLVHFAAETARVGSLAWTSMNSFERNNKRMKTMVRSNVHPEASLAYGIQLDIAARAASLEKVLLDTEPPPFIKFSKNPPSLYFPTVRQKYCLNMLGETGIGCVRSYKVAWVQGIHFCCGEWGKRTCGSVFTTVYRDRSVYGILDRFLLVNGKEFAAVTWLSQPVYPYAPFTVVVRVRILPTEDQPLNRCVISCDRIEPCGVCVMPDEDGIHYYMLRDRGHDRPIV